MSAGSFKEPELEFFCPGEGNRVLFGKAGIAILPRCAGSRLHHAVQAQVGKAIRGDVFANLFSGVAGRD